MIICDSAYFCLEECKKCNNDLGVGDEKELENYYHYFRVAENYKSRKGKLMKAEGVNYNQQNGKLCYYADDDKFTINTRR